MNIAESCAFKIGHRQVCAIEDSSGEISLSKPDPKELVPTFQHLLSTCAPQATHSPFRSAEIWVILERAESQGAPQRSP